MRAILLAGGYGTRLRPITISTPKCLVPIGGRPLLAYWLENLKLAGINSFLINTHYLKEQVEDFVLNSEFRDSVQLVYENELLGTAGTLISNLNFFNGEDGLLIHADNFCDINIEEFITAHKSRPDGCVMTMLTFRAQDPFSCGVVELDGRKIVKRFYEKVKNPPGNLANGAIYLLAPEFFEILGAHFSEAKDFSKDIVPKLLGKIFTHETNGFFTDIGTIESYYSVLELMGKKAS
jgi:mannose-1-phosphate guanylyltransferase